MAISHIEQLPRKVRGQTLYCNCQKETCFPCQNPAIVSAVTEDGTLQLCAECRKEYARQ